MFSLPVKSGWNPAPNSNKEVNFPSISILPLLGYKIFVIIFNNVLLPQPFVPINATVSPFLISKEISSNTKCVSSL